MNHLQALPSGASTPPPCPLRTEMTPSPFVRVSHSYHERGLPAIPAKPGSKVPGEYSGIERQWTAMSGWQRYAMRMPTETEIGIFESWPDGGVCLPLGGISGLIGIDIDTDDPAVLAALEHALQGLLLCRRRGAKGYCAFVRAPENLELAQANFNVDGRRVVDLLYTGRQSILPPSQHPSGATYHWVTEMTLETCDVSELPLAPADVAVRIKRALAPFQSHEDKRAEAEKEQRAAARELQGDSDFRDLNDTALAKLSAWVPALIPAEYLTSGFQGYRAYPFWRGVTDAPKCSIAPSGIRDFAADEGLTPIDLVMRVLSCSFGAAVDWLKARLGIIETDYSHRFAPAFFDPPERVVYVEQAPAEPVAVPLASVRVALPALAANTSLAELPPAPGILGDIIRWQLGSAVYPQAEMSMQSAIAFVAATMGHYYQGPTRLRGNMHLMGIARSGFGKGHPQDCIQVLLQRTGQKDLLGGSGFSSGSALLARLAHAPNTLYVIDEVHAILKAAMKPDSGSQMWDVAATVMQLYSSANSPLFSGRDYADRKTRETKPISYPYFNLLGYSTVEKFYSCLSSEDVVSGFVNRLIVAQAPDTPPPENKRPADVNDIPQSILDWTAAIRHPPHSEMSEEVKAFTGYTGASPVQVGWASDEAEELMEEFKAEVTARRNKLFAAGTGLDDVLVRWVENAHKLALVAACAVNPVEPKITSECVRWACAYVRHCGELVLEGVTGKMASTDYERAMNAVREQIAKRGMDGCTHRELAQFCRAYRGMDERSQKALMAHLINNGDVTLVENGRRKSFVATEPDAEGG